TNGYIWSPINTGLADAVSASRIRLALDATKSYTLYAGLVNGHLLGVYRWTPAAPTWVKVGTPPDVDKSGQGSPHFAMVAPGGVLVLPGSSASTVIIGGDTGGIWSGDAASGTWSSLEIGSQPHSDTRDLIMDSQGRLLAVTDGGVYRMHVTLPPFIPGLTYLTE